MINQSLKECDLHDKSHEEAKKLRNADFRFLSSGSFRHVYSRGNVVVKIPYTTDGLIDNYVEARAYKEYKDGPTKEGIYLAPCRIMNNGSLMMVKVQLGIPDNLRQDWVELIDSYQVGVYKGRLVAYDYALNLIERFEWEKEWNYFSEFFNSKQWRQRYDNINIHYLKMKLLERKVVKKMNKEDMSKQVSEQLQTIKDYANNLNRLIESLQNTIRLGDVNFSTLDDSKAVLNGMKGAREAVEKTRQVMKQRAQVRMREG